MAPHLQHSGVSGDPEIPESPSRGPQIGCTLSNKKTRADRLADQTIAAHAAAPVRESSGEAEPTVSFTVTLPVPCRILVAEDTFAEVPVSEMTDAHAQHAFMYGVGRFTRDGTTKTDEVDENGKPIKVDGKTVTRDATSAERKELAEAKWSRLVEGKLRERTVADPVVGAARLFTIKALRGRGVANKAIPKLPGLPEMEKALAAYPGLWMKVHALARAHVETMREMEKGLTLDE